MRRIFEKLARVETLYVLVAVLLPWKSLQQPPDSLLDYFPIRDAILAHPLEPSLWLSPERAYRVPGYPLFMALVGLISTSDIALRLVQGLLLAHTVWLGKRVSEKMGANPRVFAWAWTATLVHFYFAQLALSETLATWLLMNGVAMFYLGDRTRVLQGFNSTWLLFVKPAFSPVVALLLFPWWRRKTSIAIVMIIVAAWGMVLKPRAGKWVFLGAGGGLNLFISTLPGTFEHAGDDLDRYWIEEQRKIGHPAEMGWYAYDEALKRDAMKRFPHWNFSSTRFWSPFFGLQYTRGFQWKLLPFGLVMLSGLVCSLFAQLPLVSLIYLGVVAMHFIVAPFARFLIPVAPLSALMIAVMVARLLEKRSVCEGWQGILQRIKQIYKERRLALT